VTYRYRYAVCYSLAMDKQMTLSNGEKIRQLRAVAGMTQEKLALMSRIDRRTVQRAEQGTRLQMETLSSLAAALNVPVSQIIAADAPRDDVDDLTSKSLVVLNRVVSGISLLNIIRDSYDGKITCEADPTPDNIEALTGVIGKLEELSPDPWRRSGEEPSLSLSDRLRAAVTMGEQLKQLEIQGVGFFAGTYTVRTQIPRPDYETGEMYVTSRTPYELVSFFVVVVAPLTSGDRLTVKASNVYVPPKPTPSEAPTFEGPPTVSSEEIPF